jgi:hypothetical protein
MVNSGGLHRGLMMVNDGDSWWCLMINNCPEWNYDWEHLSWEITIN